MEKRWYVIQSNPRCERRAIVSLAEAGIEAFCPMQRVRRKRVICGKRRTKDIEMPLFSGYVFVAFPADDLAFGAARKCDGVAQFIAAHGRPVEIRADRVEALQVAQDMGMFDFRKARQRVQFEIGERVVIRSGWLDGQEATVEVVNSKTIGVSLETGLRVVVDFEGVEKAA
ncbi:transcription antitermination factor NusG [Breoghania corrubedonensis]|uniref:Transcription antitermination factor NusG n=1 Tax=Breoghania corrubedonensis TaxID=665038 RepID=A0A2T5VE76_9HYPH|nr:transcription termination/antitermination NusG family protein [Breoghania corrubedonensis]PTW62054.1 transcription antitermination factor NusG [Breoghania corrubedonensis]